MIDVRSMVVSQFEIDQIVHRSRDAATPVVLVFERGIISGDRWDHPLSPEFFWVQKMFIDHALGLLRRSSLRQHWIKISWRQPVAELAGAKVLIEENSCFWIPQGRQGSAIFRGTLV